jgi:hypothetical protein
MMEASDDAGPEGAMRWGHSPTFRWGSHPLVGESGAP